MQKSLCGGGGGGGGGWWVVCKVILVFRFGPRLGLKWKTWAKLNKKQNPPEVEKVYLEP